MTHGGTEILLSADPALPGEPVFMDGNGSCVHAFICSFIPLVDRLAQFLIEGLGVLTILHDIVGC